MFQQENWQSSSANDMFATIIQIHLLYAINLLWSLKFSEI